MIPAETFERPTKGEWSPFGALGTIRHQEWLQGCFLSFPCTQGCGHDPFTRLLRLCAKMAYRGATRRAEARTRAEMNTMNGETQVLMIPISNLWAGPQR